MYIIDITKLMKELVQYLLKWGINKRFCQNYIEIGGRKPIELLNNKRL